MVKGSRVKGSGFRSNGVVCRVQGVGSRVLGLGNDSNVRFGVQRLCCRVYEQGFTVYGTESRKWGFRV